MLEADLANLNAILHPPGMVCNAGWIEATGGKFGFYAEGSGRAVVRVMDAIDHERLALTGRLGVRAVPFTELFHQDQRERDAGCRQRQNSQRGAQSLKRKISDAIFARLQADARQAAAAGAEGTGGHPGERLRIQRGRLTPRTPALRTSHSQTWHQPTTRHHYRHTVKASLEENPDNHLTPTAKRTRYGRPAWI